MSDYDQTFHPKKKYILGLSSGFGPKPKPKSVLAWIQNLILYILVYNSTIKIFETHKFLILKNVKKIIRKSSENFFKFKNFQKSQFLDPNIFGCQKF
jgi:hypothetical protein